MTRKPNQILLVLTLGVMWAGCRPDVVEQPEPAEPFVLEDTLPEPTPEEPPVVKEPPVQEELLPVDCAQPAPQPERHPPGTFSWAKPGYTVVIHSAAESRYLDACQKDKLNDRLFYLGYEVNAGGTIQPVVPELYGELTGAEEIPYHRVNVQTGRTSSQSLLRLRDQLADDTRRSWVGFYMSEKLFPMKELHLLETLKAGDGASNLYALDNELFVSGRVNPKFQTRNDTFWTVFVPGHAPQDRWIYDRFEQVSVAPREVSDTCFNDNPREEWTTPCPFDELWGGVVLWQDEQRGRQALQVDAALRASFALFQGKREERTIITKYRDAQGKIAEAENPYLILLSQLVLVQ